MITIQLQKGVTLFAAMVMILLSTIIGVTAMQTSNYEEKMSTNMQDTEYAFQAAEAALREGEAWLNTLNAIPEPVVTCTTQPCVMMDDPNVFPQDNDNSWWIANTASYTRTPLTYINTPPRYVIIYERFTPDSFTRNQKAQTGKYFYRVFARGTGRNDDSVVYLETTFSRRY